MNEEAVEKRQVTQSQSKRTPQTGDNLPVVVLGGICAASLAAMMASKGRKSKR